MLQLVISLCIGASVMMELVVELVRASIFVLNVASLSARPAGQLGPLKARQRPGPFAYAGYAGSARCFCARMCCSSEFITPLVVWSWWWSPPRPCGCKDSCTKWSVTCLRLCIRWESVWIRSESARKRAEDGSDQGHS